MHRSLPPAKFESGALTRCIGMPRSSAGKRDSRSGANGLATGLGSENERPGLAAAGVVEAAAEGIALGEGDTAATGVGGVVVDAPGCMVQPLASATSDPSTRTARSPSRSELRKEPVRVSGAQSERRDDVVA